MANCHRISHRNFVFWQIVKYSFLAREINNKKVKTRTFCAVQAGLGLLQIPNLIVAHIIEKRYGLQITDRILSVFGSALMTLSCLAFGLLLIREPPANLGHSFVLPIYWEEEPV
jgi:hypothetical protein